MRAAHLDLLYALARDDASVHALMRARDVTGIDWETLLVGLVAQLAHEKAQLIKQLLDIKMHSPPPVLIIDNRPTDQGSPRHNERGTEP